MEQIKKVLIHSIFSISLLFSTALTPHCPVELGGPPASELEYVNRTPARPVLAALESFPVSWEDRGNLRAVKAHRSHLASAIESAGKTAHERRLLLAVGWSESTWSVNVCKGIKKGDGGKAWGCWQSWDPAVRGQSMKTQAEIAIKHLKQCENYCRGRNADPVIGAVSLYATGHSCNWAGARKRKATYDRMREFL